ncbi:hypothetical protein Tco_0753984 [Tanacetum coccineum]
MGNNIIDSTSEEYFHEVLNIQKSVHPSSSSDPLSGSPTPSSNPITESSSLSLTPLGDSDFLLEELATEIGLDDSIPLGVDDRFYDLEGDILYLEQLLNEYPNLDLPPKVIKENDFKQDETQMLKSSIEDPPDLELKDLPYNNPLSCIGTLGVRILFSLVHGFELLEMSSENGVNPPAPNPSHNSSFSLLSVLRRARLTSPNYMEWMRNLRFTQRYENKEYAYEMNQQLKEMFQAKARKECLDIVKSLMACKPKPGAFICDFVLEMKGYFDRLESLNMVFDAELSINIILSGLPAD